MKKQLIACIAGAVLMNSIEAKDTYQEPDAFLAETFGATQPEARFLWLLGDIKETVAKILGHPYGGLRIRYWGEDHTTAWILEEIGKEQPITVGVVVKDDAIEKLRVLIFRESRGWEVRYPFFTDQFDGAVLTATLGLDRSIDGISGATLSVSALKRLARLALYLHHQTPYDTHVQTP
jgi:hypothetical protein